MQDGADDNGVKKDAQIEMTSNLIADENEQTKEEAAADEDESAKLPEPAKVSCFEFCLGLLLDWIATLVIGFLVVTYWRGTWTLLDRWTCSMPDNADMVNGDIFCFSSGFTTTVRLRGGAIAYIASVPVHLLGVGLLWAGLWSPPEHQKDAVHRSTGSVAAAVPKVTHARALLRFIIVYILGWGTVLMWRGSWYLIDYFFLPNRPLESFWYGTLVGILGAYFMCAGSSLLAPPAIFLRDGPSETGAPPPIGVTLVSSYYSLTLPHDTPPPKLSILVAALDFFASFFVLPLFVLFFWSSFWQVMDLHWYQFTPDYADLYRSMWYSAIMGMACLIAGSDDVLAAIKCNNVWVKAIMGRFRTLILAFGAVGFWRAVWYTWDQFMGATTAWSAWTSHWLGVLGLCVLGCTSCITAPPSTLGLDVLPHPKAAEEPLFSGVPIPVESIFFFGIFRQPMKVVKGGGGAAGLSLPSTTLDANDKDIELQEDRGAPSAAAEAGAEETNFEPPAATAGGERSQRVRLPLSTSAYHSRQRPGQKKPRLLRTDGTTDLHFKEVALSERNQQKREADLTFRNR